MDGFNIPPFCVGADSISARFAYGRIQYPPVLHIDGFNTPTFCVVADSISARFAYGRVLNHCGGWIFNHCDGWIFNHCGGRILNPPLHIGSVCHDLGKQGDVKN